MGLGINPARQYQAYQFKLGHEIFSRFLVAPCGDGTALHYAHAGVNIERCSRSLGRKLFLRDVGQGCTRIEKDCARKLG